MIPASTSVCSHKHCLHLRFSGFPSAVSSYTLRPQLPFFLLPTCYNLLAHTRDSSGLLRHPALSYSLCYLSASPKFSFQSEGVDCHVAFVQSDAENKGTKVCLCMVKSLLHWALATTILSSIWKSPQCAVIEVHCLQELRKWARALVCGSAHNTVPGNRQFNL